MKFPTGRFLVCRRSPSAKAIFPHCITGNLVPTLRVGMPSSTLRVVQSAGTRYDASQRKYRGKHRAESLMDDHETAFVFAFIIPNKRERYRAHFENPKRRRKILNELNTSRDIDFSVATPVPASCSLESLACLLESMGAGPICHVIADASEMDGQDFPLREALENARSHDFAVVVSCLPGCLCYFKGESPTAGFILRRPR